ncbi:MAG TPA: DivIVA domain-containing protein [Thermoanaerobaculia bacterium]|nr:DivIVA domain-containing protein [Thermoanaerobaculia bacterium]
MAMTPLTPLDVQRMRFPVKMRGYEQKEVEDFLGLVAEELAQRISQVERLEREAKYYRQRLEETEEREHQLQQTLLRAQKVSDEITANARREAELMVKEAEMVADRVVHQAIEQTTRIETRVQELRTMRKELQLKFRNTLDLFQRILEAEMEEERGPLGTVVPLPRKKREG